MGIQVFRITRPNPRREIQTEEKYVLEIRALHFKMSIKAEAIISSAFYFDSHLILEGYDGPVVGSISSLSHC